jgi:hypothetical protein
MSHITDKTNAGSVPTIAPIITVPIPNFSVKVAEKARESFSSPPPFGGGDERRRLLSITM